MVTLKKFALLPLALLVLFSTQASAGLSAKRLPHQSFSASVSSNRIEASRHFGSQSLTEEDVVKWQDQETLQEFFEQSRDARFLTDNKNFQRRISWLYPDDGCFARAALVTQKAQEQSLPLPNRVFLYGDLEAYTSNSPNYSVTWWYHTAPIVNVNGNLYVLDASLDSSKPMLLDDWVAAQTGKTSQYDLFICSPHTYDPHTPCIGSTGDSGARALREIQFFLPREWKRQIDLQRDPEMVLGEMPPWRTSKH